jgi:hypothetical protein
VKKLNKYLMTSIVTTLISLSVLAVTTEIQDSAAQSDFSKQPFAMKKPLFTTVTRLELSHVESGLLHQAIATCEPGEVITGGGFILNSRDFEVRRSSQVQDDNTGESENAWIVTAVDVGDATDFYATATCAVFSK